MHRDYSFPMDPYQNQVDFMNKLYDCLSSCKGGIFESPTGTGKSLSIICAALTFLTDYCGDKLRQSKQTGNPQKKFKPDYTGMSIKEVKKAALLDNLNPLDTARNPKILYLSRTHSQLDQFVAELKKTKWNNREKIRLVRLGSRSQLCINRDVLKFRGLIEFKCKELTKSFNRDPVEEENEKEEVKSIQKVQKNGISGFFPKKKPKNIDVCEFYQGQEVMKEFLLDNVCDIEDLVRAGNSLTGCPYFATRSAIKEADLILAPYSSILNKHNRHVIGVDLSDCFVIIDESHNLIEAITEYHSASISKKQVFACDVMIKTYFQTFQAKMYPRKYAYVASAMKISDLLLAYIGQNERSPSKAEDRNDFIRNLGLHDIDFFLLWDFFEEDQLAAKVHECCEKMRLSTKSDLNAMKAFVEFLLCLNENDGKILLFKENEGDCILKFLLLNPYNKFQKLLSESMCVVLAGGTLAPSKEFIKLFKGIPSHQFTQFSCGHVVPKENLFITTISMSPSQQEFKFVYDNRDNIELLCGLGRVIIDIACVVPNGMIVFVPSYAFLKKLETALEDGVLQTLSKRKKVFFDSKDESALKDFSESAERAGAILFAVMRGALSEGINFSDKIGRCVILVGMPFLNRNDLEVSVKMQYYDSKNDHYSGKDFYQNNCDITINQSIGRVIRHAKDFAAIILIDSRHYSNINKRPPWMLRSLYEPTSLASMTNALRHFYRSKINLIT